MRRFIIGKFKLCVFGGIYSILDSHVHVVETAIVSFIYYDIAKSRCRASAFGILFSFGNMRFFTRASYFIVFN